MVSWPKLFVMSSGAKQKYAARKLYYIPGQRKEKYEFVWALAWHSGIKILLKS